MMNEMRQLARQPVAETMDHEMSIISFKRLDWTALMAKVIDRSPQGVGIEARSKVEPGFVWFSEKIEGSRGGLLMWSRQLDEKYRGGIKIVPLSPADEQGVQERLEEAGQLKDPAIVANAILDSLKKSGGGSIVQASS